MKFVGTFLQYLYCVLRPILGPAQCMHEVSCGPYAMEQLEQRPLMAALWNIFRRVLSCNPLSQWLSYRSLLR